MPDVNTNPVSPQTSLIISNGQEPANPNIPAFQPQDAPAPEISGPQPNMSLGIPSGQSQPAAPADPDTAKHTLIGRFFNGFVNGGSGSSASQLWRSVIAGAMAGMGAAASAPVVAHGRYGDVRDTSAAGAASRGFAAGANLRQQQIDRQNAQAARDRQQKREDTEDRIRVDDAQLRKAADARAQQQSIQAAKEHELRMTTLQQNIDAGKFDAAQRAAATAEQQAKLFNDLQTVGAKPLTDPDGAEHEFSTLKDAEDAAHKNPQFFIGDFKTRVVRDPSSGNFKVYRVPDTDLKNIQLTDPVSGQTHTIPRMTPSEYLDFQTRTQNLEKGKLSIAEAKARLAQFGEDRKRGTDYSNALKELDKVGGDPDKLSPSSRTLLYTTASKNLGDAIRAKVAADKAEDEEASAAASQAIQHYAGVLSTLHGNRNSGAQGGNLAPAKYNQVLSHVMSLPLDQALNEIKSSSTLTDADKQKLIAEVQKSTNRTPEQRRADAQQVINDNPEPGEPNPANF